MSAPRTRTLPNTKKLLSALAIAFFAASWWIFLRPVALGGETTLVTVTGTSMQPGMYTGDLAIVRKSGEYTVGEIIAYRTPQPGGGLGGTVIHRIVGGHSAAGFLMRGDNNDFTDPWRPRPAEITGELWFQVPNAGTVVNAMGDPLLAATSFAALTVFVVVIGGGRKEGDQKNEAAEPSEPGVSK